MARKHRRVSNIPYRKFRYSQNSDFADRNTFKIRFLAEIFLRGEGQRGKGKGTQPPF